MGQVEIRGLIREAAKGGRSWRIEGNSRVLDHSFGGGRTIGVDLAGQSTNAIRVVTDAQGTVITAYPIPVAVP